MTAIAKPPMSTDAAVAADPRAWGAGERERLLPRLVPIGPRDLADVSPEGRARILDMVARALGSERRRGRARHWSYSLDRHIGLVTAFAAELAAWRSERSAPWRPRGAARAIGAPMRSQNAERRGS